MATALKAEGIILRKQYLRETSYILTVFTREYGKIQGVIKGVRNPYPQFAGNFEIFTRCQLLFYTKKKRNLDLITQCETLDFFLNARKEIERLTYANYFIELINMVTAEHDTNADLYNTLLRSLVMLSEGVSPRRAGRIFEIKVLDALGMSPEMRMCADCGASSERCALVSEKSGGLICPECSKKQKGLLSFSKGAANFIKKIQESGIEKTCHIKVSAQVGKEVEELMKRFMGFHLNREFKSLAFLEKMKKAGVVKAGV